MSIETISTKVYERNGLANLIHGEKTRTTLVNKTLPSVLQITVVLSILIGCHKAFRFRKILKGAK